MVLILYLYVTVYKYLLALTYMAVHISYVASLNHTLFSATQVFITCKLIWMSEVLQPLCNSLGASGVLCGVLCGRGEEGCFDIVPFYSSSHNYACQRPDTLVFYRFA